MKMGPTQDPVFNPQPASSGYEAERYDDFLDKMVVVYYSDEQTVSRKLIGRIFRIDGDLLWLTNKNSYTGETWRCALNCANVKVSMISTVEGWGGKPENI